VVVPSVGVREWLAEQLALRLGATGARDGVAANISFRFPGVLDHFMPGRPEDDPWSVSAMTAALLPLCTSGKWRDLLAARTAAAGGPLRFASRMADRFDRYHARRPAMIRLWEAGARALAPDERRQTRGARASCGGPAPRGGVWPEPLRQKSMIAPAAVSTPQVVHPIT
jgi:exonuclease V gamma subunit